MAWRSPSSLQVHAHDLSSLSLRAAAGTAPPGRMRWFRDGYIRGQPSGSGRVRPDATRVSPPNGGRGSPQRIHASTTRTVRASHIHISNSTAGKTSALREIVRHPAAVRLSASKSSRRVKRRQALVRNAAPVAALRLGQSLHRKGLPVHDADRRALRRSTTVFVRPWPHSLSGRAFLPGLLTRSPGSPAGSLRTGLLVPVGRCPRRPGSPMVRRTRRQTVPASASGYHPDGASQQAG